MKTRFDPELSRLSFEDRLVEYLEDPGTPLLERVRLLGIYGERMDVFFMTRVGRLKEIIAEGSEEEREIAREQLRMVTDECQRMMRRSYALVDDLLGQLKAHGVSIERWEAIGEAERRAVRADCGGKLAAVVRTAILEPSEPLPHVRNLRPVLFATGQRRNGKRGVSCMAIVELPADLPRLVALPGGKRFVPLEQVIAAELPTLCPDIDVADVHLFRVTRNAHTEFDDEDERVLETVEQEIVKRPFQEVVRLEIDREMPEDMLAFLAGELQREADHPAYGPTAADVYRVPGILDLTALEQIADVDLPALRSPRIQPRKVGIEKLFDEVGSTLLHFPYDDYESSIERFLDAAAGHPDLESIRTTIYRTDKDSDVVAALRKARARGADVSVIVELKASFDERDNIELTRSLEADGVRVVLSPTTLKVHAKLALVTLRRGMRTHRIALIGTGNMNAVTARSYIDLWLATSDPVCTSEVAAMFDSLTTGQEAPERKCIMVSPFDMRPRFLGMIEREMQEARAGRPAAIRAMMNGLTDTTVIDALYKAAQAGVKIDLMVRGVCLLRPATSDLSENIRIVTLAGHLLQHARIYHFANAGRDRYFIGSADWRPRNFDKRIEVITEVGSAHHEHLDRMLTETLGSPEAWTLGADGVYTRERSMIPAQ